MRALVLIVLLVPAPLFALGVLLLSEPFPTTYAAHPVEAPALEEAPRPGPEDATEGATRDP